jgi:hypothetical protein
MFLQMDREWMYVSNRVSQHFIEQLETFLETAAEYNEPETCLMFATYVAHALIAVMRKRFEI